jgi:hypothetical protein
MNTETVIAFTVLFFTVFGPKTKIETQLLSLALALLSYNKQLTILETDRFFASSGVLSGQSDIYYMLYVRYMSSSRALLLYVYICYLLLYVICL